VFTWCPPERSAVQDIKSSFQSKSKHEFEVLDKSLSVFELLNNSASTAGFILALNYIKDYARWFGKIESWFV